MKVYGFDHHKCEAPWDGAPEWAVELGVIMLLTLSKQEAIMAAIDDLQAAVAAEDTVIDSAIALINGIPALIAAAGTDPAKLAALQADITAKSGALAAAVAANTPAAPAP
jgi:hypothetical protein